ncbi:7TM diverse intracellular signaling domain-containing protein [Solitalea lacus]|uniref:sensor histidine kinase n=1 Tax=Solitalea lacus TaxID=2911172 RepID=UPI001EDB4029|nr:7TM diverse intracellular signaling domain-containing protein [Solitalea lacus]UKJ08395.1 ATP-binding protein [Solitalea lacus]
MKMILMDIYYLILFTILRQYLIQRLNFIKPCFLMFSRLIKGALLFFSLLLLNFQFTTAKPAQSRTPFYLYADSSLKLNARQAFELFKNNKFRKLESNELNFGFTHSVFWLVYYHTNPESYLLQIGNNQINSIDLYFVNDNNCALSYRSGDFFPFAHRPVKTTEFTFPLEKKGYYIARIDKHNESLQLSFNVGPAATILENAMEDTAVIAVLSGMIILLVLFSGYLSILSKDILYLYYILYASTGWLYVLANTGHGFEYIWPNSTWFASRARPLFGTLPIPFSILFVKHYLGCINGKILRFMLQFIMYISFVASAIIACTSTIFMHSPIWLYAQYSTPLLAAVFIILTLYLIISQSIQGNRLAIFYLVAIIPISIMIVLFIGFYSGSYGTENVFIGRYGLAVGFILEVIILMAGLAYRFNRFKVDKEQLLIEMNKKQAENTRIIMNVQETERNQIANQLHDIAGSLLSAAKLNLSSIREKNGFHSVEVIQKIEKAEEAVGIVSDTVRNLSHALSPVMLSKVGFKTSLEKIISIFNASGKINIELAIIGFETYNDNHANLYTNLYSIIYELLNNIAKHAKAKNALIQVIEHEDIFSLMVEDDGIGFDPELSKNQQTQGLHAISSKVNYFEGHIEIERNSPHGSIITIEIPKKEYAI